MLLLLRIKCVSLPQVDIIGPPLKPVITVHQLCGWLQKIGGWNLKASVGSECIKAGSSVGSNGMTASVIVICVRFLLAAPWEPYWFSAANCCSMAQHWLRMERPCCCWGNRLAENQRWHGVWIIRDGNCSVMNFLWWNPRAWFCQACISWRYGKTLVWP